MRYSNETILKNESEQIKPLLENRGVSSVVHYATHDLSKIKFSYNNPTVHIWKYGDRYYKLAQMYYNNPSLWWVIAQFNNRPTENMNAYGDTVLIPKLTGETVL